MVDDYGLRPSDAGSLTNSISAYEFDYYSGSQISIYIGDILVDDIESIQFNVTQTKRPIYGYGSQYFHTVADGQVLVEGGFSIPFKEADYILAVLENYTLRSGPIKEVTHITIDGYPITKPKIQVLQHNIERYLENRSKNFTDNPFELARDLSAVSDETFENIAERFEDQLWRKPKEKFLEPNQQIAGFDFSGEIRRADQMPLFDIYILYGDIANAAANHTIKKLIDVSIVGQGQTISVGGEPISEVYRFFARNLA